MKRYIYILIAIVIIQALARCKKLINIGLPNNTITTEAVFQTDNQAKSAMAGLYYNMVNDARWFSGTQLTFLTSLSADELIPFALTDQHTFAFYSNELLSSSIYVESLWSTAYSAIYTCNAVIENLELSTSVSDALKRRLIGEAKFIRAFCYFNLVNLFGSVPLVQTTNWHNTNLLERSLSGAIYKSIIKDLVEAQNGLSDEFSVSGGERILPTRWAAKSLLCKVYVYNKDWSAAIGEADAILNNNSFFQLEELDKIFSPQSKEAIWQLKQNPLQNNLFASPLGVHFIPAQFNSNIPPSYYLTESLMSAFSLADQRLAKWVRPTEYSPTGTVYFLPYKYKVGRGQISGQYSEYHTVMRLADVYLLRAEARLNNENVPGALEDLNKVRLRSGLQPIDNTTSYLQLKDSLMHERQLELFCEWGNRWFDLKRWNKADDVLSKKSSSVWQIADTLYPVPISEIQKNPNITQNAGYN